MVLNISEIFSSLSKKVKILGFDSKDCIETPIDFLGLWILFDGQKRE
jgi:hypothetical protein